MTNLQLSFIKACTSYTITSNLFTNASILWLYVANNAESKFVRVFFSWSSIFCHNACFNYFRHGKTF